MIERTELDGDEWGEDESDEDEDNSDVSDR